MRECTKMVRGCIKERRNGSSKNLGWRKRGRGKPKRIFVNMIKNDTRAVGVCVGDVEDRAKWKSRTRVADPPPISPFDSWAEGKKEEYFQYIF